MSHEPDCDLFAEHSPDVNRCICRYVRAAYRRGYRDAQAGENP